MQDWLAEHKLDRKALQVLLQNQQAFEAHQEWIDDEVATVVDELVTALGGGPEAAPSDEPAAAGSDGGDAEDGAVGPEQPGSRSPTPGDTLGEVKSDPEAAAPAAPAAAADDASVPMAIDLKVEPGGGAGPGRDDSPDVGIAVGVSEASLAQGFGLLERTPGSGDVMAMLMEEPHPQIMTSWGQPAQGMHLDSNSAPWFLPITVDSS